MAGRGGAWHALYGAERERTGRLSVGLGEWRELEWKFMGRDE